MSGAHMLLCHSLIENLVERVHKPPPILRVIHSKLPCITYLHAARTGVSCSPQWSYTAPIDEVTTC
jgi:hypothetical protein